MKRISLWALSTFSAVVLLFSYSTSTAGSSSTPTSVLATEPRISASLNTAGPSSSVTGQTASGSAAGSRATTATVTGSVASTRWGPVQVQLQVESGTITRVDVVQYPTGNRRDQQINSYALPILTQETLDAQGAGIDMVSGATVTSRGYLSSLQSALDQAQL